MVVYVWKSYTYIEEVGHQSSFTNYIIFYLPLHLDDEVGNPDPQIAAYAREFSVDVERQSSRPNVAGTSTFGYNGSRTGIDDEGDIREHQQCQYPVSPFSYEDDFTYCTRNEYHGSRKVGPSIRAIGKPYRGKERKTIDEA
ncbi:hypothetical protein AAG906_005835 [Vitis piasezkii]